MCKTKRNLPAVLLALVLVLGSGVGVGAHASPIVNPAFPDPDRTVSPAPLARRGQSWYNTMNFSTTYERGPGALWMSGIW